MNEHGTWIDGNRPPEPSVDHPYFTRPGHASRGADDAPTTTPLQAAALRFACHLEPRPMEEVAESLGVSQQAISDMVARIRKRLGFRREKRRKAEKP